jgi:WD40 repeat protein
VVFSPSSAEVATAAEDGVARLWSWSNTGWAGPTLFRGDDSSVSDLAFSRDGQRLATASRDGTARVWQTSATWPSLVARLGGNVQHAAFGSGGEQAAVVGDGSLSSWRIDHDDASTQWSAKVSVATIRDLEVQQTGQIVAVPKEGDVLVWDRTGRQVGPDAATHQQYSGAPGPAERIVWGPQGARALIIAGGKATLWTVRDRQLHDPRPLELPPQAVASTAAFDVAGSRVVVGSTTGMFVWRLPEAPGAVPELPRVPLPMVGDTATFATFSRDGSRIVALDALGRGRVFSAEGRGTPVDLGELPLKAVTFEGDGSHVLGVSSDGRLLRWPIRWDAVIAALGRSTNACLTTEQRLRFLGESESTAVDQFEACKSGQLTQRDGAAGARRD